MNGACADFLAGAGFAQHEHRGVVPGDLAYKRDDITDEYGGAGREARTSIVQGCDTRESRICLAP
jgi:hypothetical protein